MLVNIPILLRGNNEVLTIEYTKNTSTVESGFDALDVPFPEEYSFKAFDRQKIPKAGAFSIHAFLGISS